MFLTLKRNAHLIKNVLFPYTCYGIGFCFSFLISAVHGYFKGIVLPNSDNDWTASLFSSLFVLLFSFVFLST